MADMDKTEHSVALVAILEEKNVKTKKIVKIQNTKGLRVLLLKVSLKFKFQAKPDNRVSSK